MTSSYSNIILITGANKGIGLATAKKLAKEHPDYRVLLGARSASSGQEAALKLESEGVSVEPIVIDIVSDDSISAAVEVIKTKYGRLDVLINNAGIAIDDKYVSGEKGFRDVATETYNTNVFGTMAVTEAFLPLLSLSSLPRIVFVSSMLGGFQPHPSLGGAREAPRIFAIYRSAKSAVNQFCLTYSEIYGEKGWKINATCPGYVATALNNFQGSGTVESGAINAVRLATLDKDGETGKWSNKRGANGMVKLFGVAV